MAIRQYTKEQLYYLKDSPLVQKPDNLPAIEQWLEYVYVDKDSREKLRIHHSEAQQPQNTNNARRQPHGKGESGGASVMGSFGAGMRPSLISRTTGGKNGDDISLGPPRTMFPSSKNSAKLGDSGDKATAGSGEGDEQDAPRSRFFGDRSNRKSLNEKEGKDNRESWTSARERRALGGDDEHRQDGRFNRRDRDHDREGRNGFSDKHDGRWGERRQNGDRQGGWRERERERRDKDWDREKPEKEPEWMDDPAPPSAEDDLRTMGMPRNQEQFQKWKEAMSGRKVKDEDLDAPLETALPLKEAAPMKTTTPLKLDHGVVDKPFGTWGDGKMSGSTPDSGTVSTKSAVAPKTKGSRFASMFKESQAKEETPPAEPTPQTTNQASNGNAEDEAGFNRILQMLGGTGIAQPPVPTQEGPSSPPAKPPMKQKSRFTGFFDQAAKSPERVQSPPDAGMAREMEMFSGGRNFSDEQTFGGALHDGQSGEHTVRDQGPGNEAMHPMNGNRDQQRPPSHMNDIFVDQQQVPSRNAATPDVNIQNLLASQRAQRPQGQDNKNSEFLLNLLQTKGSRPSSQQAQPQRPQDNFPLWLEQPPTNIAEPKPRAPAPPGLFEEQLLRNTPQEPSRGEQPMPERRTSQRAPPGFFDEQSFLMQQQQAQQRRNFTEPPPQHPQHPQQQQSAGRRMSGHPNLPPQMQMPPQFQGGPPPSDYPYPMHSPPGAGNQAPPPGFNPHMPRHPPGFPHNMPGMFQQGPPQHAQMQQPPQGQQHAQAPPQGYGGDPRIGGQGPPPPGFFGGGPGGGPQGMPPPPGFMGQMRSPPNEGMPTGVAGAAGARRGYESGGFDGGMGGVRR